MHLGQNIRKIREYWELSQEEFGALIGASRGMIMQYETRGSMPKNETIEKIAAVTALSKETLINTELERSKYPSLSPEALQTIERYKKAGVGAGGDNEHKGDLGIKLGKKREVKLFGKQAHLRLTPEQYAEAFGDWQGLPVYNVPITASFIETYRDDSSYQPQYYLHDPRFRDCDFGAVITGDSMHSEIRHGDIVVCKYIEDNSFIVFGDIYYIVATNGLETCKYVNRDPENKDNLLLVPRNEKMSPSPLPRTKLLRLYKVRGIVRGY